MRAVFNMRPHSTDYTVAKTELALWSIEMLEAWPGRVTWYHHLCTYIVGDMFEKSGVRCACYRRNFRGRPSPTTFSTRRILPPSSLKRG